MRSDNGPMGKNLSERLSSLRQLNSRFARWAASFTWWQMALLFLLIGVAGSMISDRLGLEHETLRRSELKSKRISPASGGECVGKRITIGGADGLVICVDEASGSGSVTKPAASAQPEASAPAAPEADRASAPAAAAPAVTIAQWDGDFGGADGRRRIWTVRGFIGDLLHVAYIALLVYFIAAKIIVRQSAESEARVRTAVDTAEHEAMQRQLVQARLKLLQAQIEPHFLFNTLAAVDYLIETDPPRASVMQKTLIQYLRAALPQMRQESSSLGRELQLTRAYLALLKMRIEDRLQVDINVPQGLESAVFPPMMLQTLVENAIKHGIEPKPEGGKVSVMARVQAGQLMLEVADTGVGLPSGDLFAAPTTGTGLGLENIRDRLAMLYPNASRMELSSDATLGTMVRIVIPYTVAVSTQPEAAVAGSQSAPLGSAGLA